jgi:hypothetical protein
LACKERAVRCFLKKERIYCSLILQMSSIIPGNPIIMITGTAGDGNMGTTTVTGLSECPGSPEQREALKYLQWFSYRQVENLNPGTLSVSGWSTEYS